MIDDKYIGLALAVSSSLAIVILGEVCNFAAYAFAPAILVTPLGALSVLIGAVLGSYILKEELGTLGKLGCAICLLGAIIIVLHAPADEDIQTIDQILHYAIQPVKAFGIALKLTLAGHNQFTHPSTYVFMILTAVCILTQMNYFNKALSQFTTQIVNPLYYVTFTTATLCASFILFSGFNTTDTVNTLSLLCGFLITFTGVYLLNLSRADPHGMKMLAGRSTDATGTDMISSFQTRRSMQARRSTDPRSSIGSRGHTDRDGLMRAYDEEAAAGEFGLTDLAEDSEDEPPRRSNGYASKGHESIELEPRKSSGE
ncbi:hypothetical protein DL769_010326 [Monosporascus sp. CRB-8-3]|nr:hypothetical protein DL769_010326 [Monosporascus sp. CRB-8-3]